MVTNYTTPAIFIINLRRKFAVEKERRKRLLIQTTRIFVLVV